MSATVARKQAKVFIPDHIYRDKEGDPIYGVCVLQGTSRRVEYHFDPGEKVWRAGRNGLAGIPYNLPQIVNADPVWIVPCEEAADALRELGACATTSIGGLGRWNPAFGKLFRGKIVYILPRNTAEGREQAERVFFSVMDKAREAKIVSVASIPEGGDVRDWIAERGRKANYGNLVFVCESYEWTDRLAMEAARSKRITDTGNAEQFVARNRDSIRFCHSWGDWLLWDGARWQRDRGALISHLAKEMVDEIWEEVREYEGDEYANRLKKWATLSRSHGKRSALLSLAREERDVSVTHQVFDTHRHLLNVRNGVLDLDAGTLGAHDPELYLTRIAPVEYDPAASAPTWLRFVERIFMGNADLISYVQKAAGYALTGYTHEQCFFFCYGTGANGKSTFVETLLFLMGDYGEKTSISTLMAKENDGGDANPALIALQAARLVVSSEIEEGKRWNESLVKDLSGSDRISARPLYGNPITFFPEFKLFVYGNHKPAIRGTDKGIKRRIKLIPFTVTIPPEEKDERLGEKLRAELSGILNWCLAGWQKAKREGMKAPSIVESATDSYFAEQDLLQTFLEDMVEVVRIDGTTILDPNVSVKNAKLYEVYEEYNRVRRQWSLSHRVFTQRLTEKGFEQRADRKGRPWIGMRLREGGDADF